MLLDFFRFFGLPRGPNLPSVRKVNCRKTNKKEEKEKEKGTVQDREHACRILTRLRAAEQARGGSQLPAAIYPPRACKDRCMRKSVGGWSACVNFAIFCRWVRKISKTDSEGAKNEKK